MNGGCAPQAGAPQAAVPQFLKLVEFEESYNFQAAKPAILKLSTRVVKQHNEKSIGKESKDLNEHGSPNGGLLNSLDKSSRPKRHGLKHSMKIIDERQTSWIHEALSYDMTQSVWKPRTDVYKSSF